MRDQLHSKDGAENERPSNYKYTVILLLAALFSVIFAAIGTYILKDALDTPLLRSSVVKVAVIGDSITYGIPASSTAKKASYPLYLQSLLGSTYKVINYGVSGRTLSDSGDMPYTKEPDFKESQKEQPDVVLIMLGTNDSKPHNWNRSVYEKDLVRFVNVYKNLPSKPHVYLLSPPTAYSSAGEFNVTVINDEISSIVKRTAETEGIKFIDIHSATANKPQLFSDGIHPNIQGYEFIAKTIYEKLQ